VAVTGVGGGTIDSPGDGGAMRGAAPVSATVSERRMKSNRFSP
jgi:hypothetical protein